MGIQSIKKHLYRFGLLSLSLLIATELSAATGSKDKKAEKKSEKKVEESDDGSRYILNCSECHGFDGNSISPEWPNIAGLNKSYIIRQLKDFKEGKRVNEEMTQIVKEFPSDKELASLAKYFSKQKIINPNTSETIKQYSLVDLKLGEEIFTGKRIEYGIPACSACHGKEGLGDNEGKFPRLVGQHMAYTIKQMKLFRSKERSNDTPAQMRNIALKMDDEDIESVAAYIAYMSIERD
ncbi:MAG: cytochrome c4 [Cocleimonas sp.]|nr:cytochrome c4 [Cocleimonas sp.]